MLRLSATFSLEDYSEEAFRFIQQYSAQHLGVPIYDFRGLDRSTVPESDWGKLDSPVHGLAKDEDVTSFFATDRQRIYMVGNEYPTATELVGVTLHELGHARQHSDGFPLKLVAYLEQHGHVAPSELNHNDVWSNYESSPLFRLVIERHAWHEAFRIREALGIEAPAMRAIYRRANLRDGATFAVDTGQEAEAIVGPILKDYENGRFDYTPRPIPERHPSDSALCPLLRRISSEVEGLIERRYVLKETSKSLIYPVIFAEADLKRVQEMQGVLRQVEELRTAAQTPNSSPEAQAAAGTELANVEHQHQREWRSVTGLNEISRNVLDEAWARVTTQYQDAHREGEAVIGELRSLHQQATEKLHERIPIKPERHLAAEEPSR